MYFVNYLSFLFDSQEGFFFLTSFLGAGFLNVVLLHFWYRIPKWGLFTSTLVFGLTIRYFVDPYPVDTILLLSLCLMGLLFHNVIDIVNRGVDEETQKNEAEKNQSDQDLIPRAEGLDEV